jgi:1-acyl-sn-glycerol-3-phosphate acyltransferase
MNTLRFIIFNLVSWLTVAPFALLVLVAWPFGHRYAYIFARMWALLVMWLARIICGLSYRVIGTENIPDQSCVFFR